MVLGTVERKVWKEGLGSKGLELGESLKHVAQFKTVYDFTYEPGGWYLPDEESEK